MTWNHPINWLNKSTVSIALVVTLAVCTAGEARAATNPEAPDPDRVQAGDLVTIDYVATLENGQLVRTTLASVAQNPERAKATSYTAPDGFGPEEILAGDTAAIPGLADKVIGMKVGDKQRITLLPNEAYGPMDPRKITAMARIQRMPRLSRMNPMQWAQRFEEFPQVGQEVQLVPYFKSRVTMVEEHFVELEALVSETTTVQSVVGPVEIRLEGDEVIAELKPEIGTPYQRNDETGRIVSTDETTFSVDFNPELAGQILTIDVEVKGLTKASTFKDDITWVEDHDLGLEKASQTDKPAVLVLYAGWCGWSKKLLNTSLKDPRIKAVKDHFIWIKVNSDEHKEYYQRYQQNGYPLILVFDSGQQVIQRINGYRDGTALRKELGKLLVSGDMPDLKAAK